MQNKIKLNSLVSIYIVAIVLIALGVGFSESVFSNYFKDAYDITAEQRGFIEIPRELPGVISIFIIASLARLGDLRITMISQFTSFIGILILGFTTPEFYVMTFFVFVYSLGQHVYLPLVDSIAMSITTSENLGTALGKFKGITTASSLVAAIVVFFGFRTGIFSFEGEIKWIFILAALLFLLASITLNLLYVKAKEQNRVPEKPKLLVKKKYKYYYILAVMNGVQKQIVLVYSPWVIIEILGRGTDTTAILLIISSLCGIFFMPFIGRCIDKFGIKKMLYVDALSFILVYVSFAYIVYNLHIGVFSITGFACYVTFLVFIFDRMSWQMGIIRTMYLKTIVDDKSDILPTISFGVAIDHIVAIACSYLSGMIWVTYGPHVIFILAASLSLINLAVAKLVKIDEPPKPAQAEILEEVEILEEIEV